MAINGDEMIIIGNYLIAPLKKCERWVPGVEGCGASTRGGLSDPGRAGNLHLVVVVVSD